MSIAGTTTLDDVAYLRKEKFNPISSDDRRYIALENIEPNSGKLKSVGSSLGSKSQKAVFHKGDVLFNKLRPYLKKYWLAEFEGVCTTELLVLQNKANIDNHYLYYLTSDDAFIQYINQRTFGTKMPRADWSIVKDYEIVLPSLEVQRRIVGLLKLNDEVIDYTQKIIDCSEILKQAISHDLFSNDGWSRRPLGELLDKVIDHRGKTPKKMGGDWSESGIPAISAMNVKNNKIVRPEMFKYVDKPLYKKWMKVELEEGDLLLTSEAPMGEMYIVKPGEKYCLSQRLFGLRVNKDRIIPKFVYYYLNSVNGAKELDRRKSGSTAQGIRQSELVKIEVPVPAIKYQREISDVLFALDEKIDVNKKIKNRLMDVKKGLMQDLLTGRVGI